MKRFTVFLALLLTPLSASATINFVQDLVINGGDSKAITIKPTGPTEYAPLKWLDQQDNNVAQIVCHEQQTLGDYHNHCTWYTALADRTKRTGRFDLQFGVDFARWTVESSYIVFQKGAYIEPVLKTAAGKRYKVLVGEDGTLSTQLMP